MYPNVINSLEEIGVLVAEATYQAKVEHVRYDFETFFIIGEIGFNGEANAAILLAYA
jgi:hypothetical protein